MASGRETRPVTPRNRLTCAALVAAAVSTGCGDREATAPSANVETVAGRAGALLSADDAARAEIAIRDALARVIPGLGSDDRADALHDAFDLVADALERGDRKLDRRIADAGKLVGLVRSQAPPHWLAELDALGLALAAVAPSP